MTSVMDIYTRPGSKIKFTASGGYDFEKEQAKKLLTLGQEYILSFADVGRSSTRVYLQGFGENEFNSCLFQNVEEETKFLSPEWYNESWVEIIEGIKNGDGKSAFIEVIKGLLIMLPFEEEND